MHQYHLPGVVPSLQEWLNFLSLVKPCLGAFRGRSKLRPSQSDVQAALLADHKQAEVILILISGILEAIHHDCLQHEVVDDLPDEDGDSHIL